jgi:fructokinase
VPRFYDVNLRQNFFTRDVLEWGLRQAHVVKVNDAEASLLSEMLFGEAMAAPRFAQETHNTYGVQVVLVTLGADGCLVATPDGVTHVPGHPVAVVDTVGAGDAFSAGFLAAWLRGQSPPEAAAVGNTLGAYVAARRGAIPLYSDDLRRRLSDLIAGSGKNITDANL